MENRVKLHYFQKDKVELNIAAQKIIHLSETAKAIYDPKAETEEYQTEGQQEGLSQPHSPIPIQAHKRSLFYRKKTEIKQEAQPIVASPKP